MSDDGFNAAQGLDPPCLVEAKVIAPRPPGPGFWGAVGCCLLMLGAQIGISVIAIVVWAISTLSRTGVRPDPVALQEAIPMTLLIGSATMATLFSGLLVAAIAYRGQTARRLALRNPTAIQWVTVVLIVLPLSLIASEITNWVARLVPAVGAGDVFSELAQDSLGGALLFGALLAAVGEEVWFRGIIGRGLVGRYGTVVGIVITSLLFGLVHIEPVQASGAIVLGVGIHGIYLATRSLYAAIAVHGLNNALAFTVLALQDRLALPGYLPGEDGGINATPRPLLLAALAAVVGLALVMRDTRTRFVMADGQPWNPGYLTGEQPPSGIEAKPQHGQLTAVPILVAVITQAAFLAALISYMR